VPYSVIFDLAAGDHRIAALLYWPRSTVIPDTVLRLTPILTNADGMEWSWRHGADNGSRIFLSKPKGRHPADL
jgi:hypothetical protein